VFGWIASAALILAGIFNVTNGLFSAPPAGRADLIPDHPIGRTVLLAPLDDFAAAELEDLAEFYAVRYGIEVDVLPPASIPASARDPARYQLVAEELIDVLRAAYPEAGDPDHVVIGVTSDDLYIRSVPDWNWAFGFRDEGHLAVVSTARMGPALGPFGHRLEPARLRKMVTKNIGVLYFELRQSDDPVSVLYDNILGLDDLDGMGEDF
jgi:predicted Zn-dependent protease